MDCDLCGGMSGERAWQEQILADAILGRIVRAWMDENDMDPDELAGTAKNLRDGGYEITPLLLDALCEAIRKEQR